MCGQARRRHCPPTHHLPAALSRAGRCPSPRAGRARAQEAAARPVRSSERLRAQGEEERRQCQGAEPSPPCGEGACLLGPLSATCGRLSRRNRCFLLRVKVTMPTASALRVDRVQEGPEGLASPGLCLWADL